MANKQNNIRISNKSQLDEEKELMGRIGLLEKNYNSDLLSEDPVNSIQNQIKNNFSNLPEEVRAEAVEPVKMPSIVKSRLKKLGNINEEYLRSQRVNEIQKSKLVLPPRKSKIKKYYETENLKKEKSIYVNELTNPMVVPNKDFSKPIDFKSSISNLLPKINIKNNEIRKEIGNLEEDEFSGLNKEELEKIKKEKIKDEKEKVELKRIDRVNYGKRPSESKIKKSNELIEKLRVEISKSIIGQKTIMDALIMGLLCNGHILVEGVPGIAKTLLIRSLARASGCTVKRIQFTVDLLPTDITGITTYTPEKGFEFVKGPIFTNFLIADEINRSPSKTQSALLEGMQERQVTIGKKQFMLPEPFFVMATENPLETAGVYQLPEAQIDRFLFKVIMGYPTKDEEAKIVEENMTLKNFEDFGIKPVITPNDIIEMQNIVKDIYLGNSVKKYILDIVEKTRNKEFKNSEYVSFGASPRASIAMFIASKANALMKHRNYVLPEDIKVVVYNVLRHRILLSYKASIHNVTVESLIKEILNEVKVG